MSIENVNFELESGSVGMGIRKVSQEISYSDFTDANGTGTLTMTDSIPAGSFVLGSKITVKTGFTGGGSACTLKIGDATDNDAYSGASTHAIVAAATNLVKAAFIVSDCGMNAEGADNDILLVATDSNNDWSEVSAGNMTVEVFYLSTVLELP